MRGGHLREATVEALTELGVMAIAIGAALAPSLAGFCFAHDLLDAPLYIAGGVKILFDLLLYRAFTTHRPDGDVPR